jgi:membrane protein DedA with SNARE-associated domain
MDRAALFIYAGVFLALVAAGVGFPIPEELPIVTAGALAGHQSGPPPKPPAATAVHPDHLAALAVAPGAAFPATLPWGGMALAGRPYRDRLPPEFCAALAANPHGPPPANLPWPALVRTCEHVPQPRLKIYWWVLLPICIAGVVISDALLYTIGRMGGLRVLRFPLMRRILPPERLVKIEHNFQKYGVLILLFARVLPGIRAPIFLTAGIMRLPLRRFLLADGIYAIPGVSLLFFLAFWFTDQFRDLIISAEEKVAKVRSAVVLALLVAVILYLVFKFWRHPVHTGEPEELPVIGERVAAKMSHADLKVPPPHPDGAQTPAVPQPEASPPEGGPGASGAQRDVV